MLEVLSLAACKIRIRCSADRIQSQRIACLQNADVPPGLLFDWALPTIDPPAPAPPAPPAPGRLSPPLTRKPKPDLGAQFGALSVLRECLAAVEPVVLSRYAAAVFDALEAALEAEGTDAKLLPPLLGVLMQV